MTTTKDDSDIAQLQAEGKFSADPDVSLAEMNAEANVLLKLYTDMVDSEDNLAIDSDDHANKLVEEFQRVMFRLQLLSMHVGAGPTKTPERTIQ